MSHAPAKIYLPLIGELVAALAMLAILVLSFAPVTPANSILSSASASETYAIEASWCGDPASGEQTAHPGACHACRVDAAKIPQAPCVAEPAFAGLILAPQMVLPTPALSRTPEFANGTRAPPAAV